jgi:hypothetical protein
MRGVSSGKKKESVHLTGRPDDIVNDVKLAELLGCSLRQAEGLLAAGVVKGVRSGRGGWRLTWRAVVAHLEAELK